MSVLGWVVWVFCGIVAYAIGMYLAEHHKVQVKDVVFCALAASIGPVSLLAMALLVTAYLCDKYLQPMWDKYKTKVLFDFTKEDDE